MGGRKKNQRIIRLGRDIVTDDSPNLLTYFEQGGVSSSSDSGFGFRK